MDMREAMAAINRVVLADAPYRATVRIPTGAQDEYGQPREDWLTVQNIPAWLSTAPHPTQTGTARVADAEDWHRVYLHDGILTARPVDGTQVDVYDLQGHLIAALQVEGDPAPTPGRWVVKCVTRRE